jgi:hypothetical protein
VDRAPHSIAHHQGYDYLIEILADPEHEERQDRLEWLGLDPAAQFDPAAFDLTETNKALSGLATVLVKGQQQRRGRCARKTR